MANVNLTTFRAEDVWSTHRAILGIYTGPASYVAGGDPFTPGEVKLGQLHVLLIGQPTNGTVIVLAEYDYTNQKLKLFDLAGVEIAPGVDLSTYTTRFVAVGL